MSVIYLVRHGQASFGASDYDKLSAIGVRQSRLVAERLPKPDRVVTGSLTRHRDTAAGYLDALGLDLTPEIDPRWDEYDHRDIVVRHKPAYRNRLWMKLNLALSGSPGRAYQEMFDEALLRWVAADAGYNESWAVFSERAGAALADLAGSLESSQTAVVFTSGGPISAITANLLTSGDGHGDTGAQVWLNLNRIMINTGITKVVTGRRGTTLVSFNDHSHLDGELLTYR
jgi:broad specificity phosphatase PhoE